MEIDFKKYDCFIAECYEAEDEFWEGVFEDIEADYWESVSKDVESDYWIEEAKNL